MSPNTDVLELSRNKLRLMHNLEIIALPDKPDGISLLIISASLPLHNEHKTLHQRH